jgi:(1->4)-alpha-D-glucan 1-alpha-D-glucosylmutase
MSPRATYRLQFHKGFTFADAARHAGYFAEMGVSHIYASPILTARAGSTHGYDVVDHSRINPELGGEDGFRAMAQTLRAHGLGAIVDIVPNHMAVGKADNGWWQDLLANGPTSRYAKAFDIDWDAPELEGKVLAPFLGEEPRAALEKGDLKLVRENGRLAFVYYDHRFPLRPEDQALPDRARNIPELEAILARQHFALADWRQADARINWRRFFDITDLAAIRIGEPEVFETVHRKIFALYAEGLIDGVRVDHVDGLADPRAYCRTLRARLEDLRPGAVIYVEKILAEGESLAADWQIDGTTGYDFLDQASAVLHHDDGGLLSQMWSAISGRSADFEQEELLARHQILATKFPSQLAATARSFSRLLGQPAEALAPILAELLLRLRCYRSYATGKPDTPGPGPFLEAAFQRTMAEVPSDWEQLSRLALIFHRDDDNPLAVDALRRFAQLSAPLAAKAVEDTAFYRHGRLLSRNDVGTNPRCHFLSVADFHRQMEQRAREQPHAMLTTATHDHKRGEDARARLSALSLEPALWQEFIGSAPVAPGLDHGDIYQLHQTLFGAWPEELDGSFTVRIAGWCTKFLREGKLRSAWNQPDEAYEARFRDHAGALIEDERYAGFRQKLAALLARLKPEIDNAIITQLVLRNTVPGVPDLYQGCEFEDLSLVDPDNRRAVDFERRARALDEGKIEKQRLLNRLLTARRHDPDLWDKGTYRSLQADRCLAFRRDFEDRTLAVFLRRDAHGFGSDIVFHREGTDLMTGRRFAKGAIEQRILFAHHPAVVIHHSKAPP